MSVFRGGKHRKAPAHRRYRKLAIAGLGAAALTVGVAPAGADQIYNSIDGSIDATAESINLTAGGTDGSVTFAVQAVNSDGKNGCNLTGSTTLVVNVVSSSVSTATVSPSQLSFDSCGATRAVSVHPLATGSTTVTLMQVSNNTDGTFDLAPATFVANVSSAAPANTAPHLVLPSQVTAEAGGASGANVGYTVSATDAEDNPPPTPHCSPASGSLFPIGTTTVNCAVTDSGGLADAGSFPVHVVDTTAPSVSVSAAGVDASTGWFNIASSGTSGVVVTASASDVVGVTDLSCTDNSAPVTLSAAHTFTIFDGIHDVVCTASDAAGNSAWAADTYQVDQTSPAITPHFSQAPNGDGWNNADLTISYDCSDATSGLPVNACPDEVVSTEGTTTVTKTVTDTAGNAASSSSVVNLDKTSPVIIGAPDRPANGNGWYNGDVTVTFQCSDALSDIKSCSGPTTLTEGAGQSVTGSAVDRADNSQSATVDGINIDKTAPTITFDRTPANGNGWNNSDVTVTFHCIDGLSGVDTLTDPVTLTAEGAGQAVTGTCVDRAGNSSAVTASAINIDKTAPTITGERTPANANGWNNGDVVVGFTCTDTGGSGIATDTVAGGTLTAEGAGQSLTNSGDCVDEAGNTATPETVGDINIDKSPPSLTGSRSPAANGNGWNNSDVTVTFHCTDALSDVATLTDPVTLSSDGADQSVTGTCTDKAGNTASATVGDINIDKTAPTLSPIVTPNPVLLNGSASAAAGAADSLSGIASSGCGAVDTTSVGSKTVTCTATDTAGNTATASAGYTVQYAGAGSCLGSAGHAILQPINVDGSSIFKLGSTVPAKFRVCDANGNSIGTPGVVTGFKLVQKTTTTVTAVNEDVLSTTPDTAFRWDPTAQQWIFNISTKSGSYSSGMKLTYQITLNDGSMITFGFALK